MRSIERVNNTVIFSDESERSNDKRVGENLTILASCLASVFF